MHISNAQQPQQQPQQIAAKQPLSHQHSVPLSKYAVSIMHDLDMSLVLFSIVFVTMVMSLCKQGT